MSSIPFVLHLSRRIQMSAIKIRPSISSSLSPTQVSAESEYARHKLTKIVGRVLALRLIGILQLLPAASALPSEEGNAPLSGDIALLYARLSSNQTEFRHVAQLVKDVAARAEDTRI